MENSLYMPIAGEGALVRGLLSGWEGFCPGGLMSDTRFEIATRSIREPWVRQLFVSGEIIGGPRYLSGCGVFLLALHLQSKFLYGAPQETSRLKWGGDSLPGPLGAAVNTESFTDVVFMQFLCIFYFFTFNLVILSLYSFVLCVHFYSGAVLRGAGVCGPYEKFAPLTPCGPPFWPSLPRLSLK